MTYICDTSTYQTKVLSSKGEQYYDISHSPNGGWNCSCPAFQYRGKETCKHIESIKDDLCQWQGDEAELDDGCCPLCGSNVKQI